MPKSALPPISRRVLIGGLGVSPALPSLEQFGACDALALCSAWFAIARELTQLTYQWQKIETKMMRDPAWAALSREQRRFAPAQIQLAEIDELKDGLQDRQHEYLEQLVLVPTKDISDTLSKLSVVMGVMYPEDYPHCYALIAASARALASFTCPHCDKALARAEAIAMVDEAARTWSTPN